MKNAFPRLLTTNVTNVVCQNRLEYFFHVRFGKVGELLSSVAATRRYKISISLTHTIPGCVLLI
jgi:hypothetical protein